MAKNNAGGFVKKSVCFVFVFFALIFSCVITCYSQSTTGTVSEKAILDIPNKTASPDASAIKITTPVSNSITANTVPNAAEPPKPQESKPGSSTSPGLLQIKRDIPGKANETLSKELTPAKDASSSQSGATASVESPIVLRTPTLEDSLRETLDDNAKLKDEIKKLKEELSKISAREGVTTARIRMLSERADNYRTQLEAVNANYKSEKEKLTKEVEDLSVEKKLLESTARILEAERGKDVYFNKWKDLDSKFKSYKDDSEKRLIALKKESDDKLKSLEEDMRKAIPEAERMKEENGKLHFNLGNSYLKKGEYKKAAYEYEFAQKYLPGDADISYNLAVLYDYYLQKFDKAIKYYKDFIDKNPNSKYANIVKERIADNVLKLKAKEITSP